MRALADMMQEWVEGRGCDGFDMMPPVFPASLVEFDELLIPEQQRRSAYRTACEGTTLRANLGLTRPAWQPTPEQRVAVVVADVHAMPSRQPMTTLAQPRPGAIPLATPAIERYAAGNSMEGFVDMKWGS